MIIAVYGDVSFLVLQGDGVRGQGDFIRLGGGVRPHPGGGQTGTVCLLSGTRPLLRPQIRVQR